MEFIGVLLSWISKWYKSGDCNRHRRIGFLFTLFVSIYWMIWFLYAGFYWLASHSIVNIYFGIRGTKNNKKEKVMAGSLTETEREKVFRDECPDCGGKLVNSRRGMQETRNCLGCDSVFVMIPKIDIKRG